MTANQLYKESNSNLSFKMWLKENQTKGILDNHEKMFNLMGVDGDIEEEKEAEPLNSTPIKEITPKATTPKKAKVNMGMLNIVGIIGVGVLLYGLATTKAE